MSDVPSSKQIAKPMLSPEQARVFACLMEKHLATPNNYPLTINSLMLACNQKTNRAVLMDLSLGQVEHLVGELVDLDYARLEYGDRTQKAQHRAAITLKLSREEQAVLAMLMLREPLTLADIKARTERMVDFSDLDEIQIVVDDMIGRDKPLLVLIPKGSGRREDRYTHLLCGEPNIECLVTDKPTKVQSNSKLEELEARVEKLEQALQELMVG